MVRRWFSGRALVGVRSCFRGCGEYYGVAVLEFRFFRGDVVFLLRFSRVVVAIGRFVRFFFFGGRLGL